jgi:hypothetical protein
MADLLVLLLLQKQKTPLHAAAYRGKWKMVKDLLYEMAQVDVADEVRLHD